MGTSLPLEVHSSRVHWAFFKSKVQKHDDRCWPSARYVPSYLLEISPHHRVSSMMPGAGLYPIGEDCLVYLLNFRADEEPRT